MLVRNALTLWAVVAIVAAAMGAAVFLLPRTTGASEHTATRTLPESPVAAGGEFTVTIDADEHTARLGMSRRRCPPGSPT